MKLNVDLSELSLAAAKMQGLDSFLCELRKVKKTYKEGLNRAKTYVLDNGGRVEKLADNQTKLILGDEEAVCFKPYPDIDLFYYEN